MTCHEAVGRRCIGQLVKLLRYWLFPLIGLALILASDWMLILLVPALMLLHFGVVLREERYLGIKFDDAYRRYRSDVPRYGWNL